MEYTKEQLKAAYALNLCTVSVSQIIDYNDINVMEQEYEAILNNLNLEAMPKDEALLKILKQILDTITYFRIEEGDKKFIEKEYQQKMKNAIWSAVPNIGMIVAGGSPLTMGVSLASQVGLGYMNYRKAKADNALELEKQKWQLERTAIEQFNGLRRELFDTAWRLSATHHFPDELRLTERQIHQYDEILMDGDLLRKYYRMGAVQEAFLAYPPFWYYFGSVANEIAQSELHLTEEAREQFRLEAVDHFRQYRKSSEYGLLREDEIKASCALELVDLLSIEQDRDEIQELLEEAIKASGKANDVLQLSAMTYLKLNEQDRAAELLSQLVNEEYNTVLNAQLLSSIYVHRYAQTGSDQILFRYEVLNNQVGEHYLYPLPKEGALSPREMEEEFVETQKENLYLKYQMTLEAFCEKYTVLFGKIIPLSNPEEEYTDLYFDGSEASIEERKYQLRKTFARPGAGDLYKEQLREREMNYALLDLLNEMFDALCFLDIMDGSLQNLLAADIEEALEEQRDQIQELIGLINHNEIDLFGVYKLLEIPFSAFTGKFFTDLYNAAENYVLSRTEMQDFAIAEDNLVEFCNREDLPNPAEAFGVKDNLPAVAEMIPRRRFDATLFGETKETAKTVQSDLKRIKEILEEYGKNMINNPEELEFLIMGDPKIARYFRNNPRLKDNGPLMAETIAILDDKAQKGDLDLIFAQRGIVPVKNGVPKRLVFYREVKLVTGKYGYLDVKCVYDHPGVEKETLYQMLQEMTPLMKEPVDSKPSGEPAQIKLPKFKIPFQK